MLFVLVISVRYNVFCCLQGATDYSLVLKRAKNLSIILAYSNVDWSGCPDNFRSTIRHPSSWGLILFLGVPTNNLLSPNPLQMSSTRSFYIQLLKPSGFGTSLLSWALLFVSLFGFFVRISLPPTLLPTLSFMGTASILKLTIMCHDRVAHVDLVVKCISI